MSSWVIVMVIGCGSSGCNKMNIHNYYTGEKELFFNRLKNRLLVINKYVRSLRFR